MLNKSCGFLVVFSFAYLINNLNTLSLFNIEQIKINTLLNLMFEKQIIFEELYTYKLRPVPGNHLFISAMNNH